MLTRLRLRILQAIEHLRDDGWSKFWRSLVSLDRKAFLAEKRLDEAVYETDLFERNEIVFLALTPELLRNGYFRFVARNRYIKAKVYLKQGYGGHAIARGRDIIGDIWYYPASPMSDATSHPDLEWLGIKLDFGSVYSFDSFLAKNARGGNRSLALQGRSYNSLRDNGFEKAFAYYWADNTAAVWNTRVIYKWTELKALRVRSIFLQRKVIEARPILPRSAKIDSETAAG